MAAYNRVAIVGASGSLGVVVLKELISAGFEVTAIVRTAGKLPADLAGKFTERTVDLASQAALADALRGHDVLVSAVGAPAFAWQASTLLPAAIAAGVRRVLPSEFGCDLRQPAVRACAAFADQVVAEDLLAAEAARDGGATTSYTFVYCNLFLDWCLRIGHVGNLTAKTADLYDGGSHRVSFACLSTVAEAVVAVLRHPDETENKHVYVHDGSIRQRDFVAALKDAAGPEGWTVTEQGTAAMKAKSDKALSEGVFEPWVFMGHILFAAWAESNKPGYEDRSWNKVLGLKEYSEGEMKGLVKSVATDILAGR
ncbi:hypothetical protein RB595_008007 [Gaeumannomyces hyphopodioides]